MSARLPTHENHPGHSTIPTMKDVLTENELSRLREAVQKAEGRTSGEIVPYVVKQSDSYPEAVWKGAIAGASVALLIAVLIFNFYQGWGFGWLHTGWGTALLAVLAGVAGGIIVAIAPPVRRTLAGSGRLFRIVHLNAMKAFVEEEIFKTRDRTGILLFISVFEHRIEVLGDTGINKKVSSDEWVDVVEHIREGIKGGRLVEGLVEGIEMCGRLLEKSGVELRSDDVNELPNAVRFRKDE